MLTGMRHIELHVVQTPTDAEAAVAAGLLEDDFYLTDCSACGDEIGAADEFVPYVLCLDEDFQWAMVEPDEDDAFDNFVEIDD